LSDELTIRPAANARLLKSTHRKMKGSTSMLGQSVHVNGVDIKILDPLDLAMQRMYFGWKGIVEDSNAVMARHGLARAHHRIIFVIARADGIAVGELLKTLNITAQALQRPMAALVEKGFVVAQRDPVQHRKKKLSLTGLGLALENDASEAQRAIFRRAFDAAGADSAEGWSLVMQCIYEAALAEHLSPSNP
jgi:DNA-binding MarR family transcriptional regulator